VNLHRITISLRTHPLPWIVAIGLVLRLARYLADRSLWLDEAMLAQSLLTYSPRELLTKPLLHWQAAPVGYLLLEKATLSILGGSEYSLRLVPLLMGIGSMILFALLSRKILNRAGTLTATALFASTESLIYYSSEVKQYEGDVFICILILWLALRWIKNRRISDWTTLLLAGIVSIFLSHTAVFILGGIAFAFPPLPVRRERAGVRIFVFNSTMLLIWLILFLLNYSYFLHPLTQVQGLRTYWANAFMPKQVGPAIIWTGVSLRGLFASYYNLWLPLPEVGILLGVIGLIALARNNDSHPNPLQEYRERGQERCPRNVLVLLLAPIAFALAASAIGQFPFGGRVILFTMPLVILLIGAGTDVMLQTFQSGQRWIPATSILLLLAPTIGRAAFYLAIPPGREEIRPMLDFLAANNHDGDLLYCPRLTEIPLRYYLNQFDTQSGNPRLTTMPRAVGLVDYDSTPPLESDLIRLRGRAHVWILITHPDGMPNFNQDQATREILDHWGKCLTEAHARGASLYLYDLER